MIGVIAYVIVPFLRDIASAMEFTDAAVFLDSGVARIGISMAMIWGFVGVNVRGAKFYERTLIPMMFVMFALGAIVIVAGFSFDHADFEAALMEAENRSVPTDVDALFSLPTFLAAAALLFASFIGFDAIAQAGGEAKNPGRNLPLAIGIAILTRFTEADVTTADALILGTQEVLIRDSGIDLVKTCVKTVSGFMTHDPLLFARILK